MTYSGLWVPDEHLNPNLTGLTTSATIAIQQLSRDLSDQGRQIFRLGLGQSPFPVPAPVVEALQENAHQKDYLPVKGLPELRKILTEHHQRVFGIECSTEDIIVGPGSKELMFILQLVYDGEIIIPMPAWVSYLPQARIVGRSVNSIMTTYESGWKITPEQLDAICRLDPTRARLLILNYPSNPTGQTYSRDELEALSEVCRKYKLLVLSDEIYAKTTYDSSHESLVTIYPEGTIFSGGLSKWCGAGGLALRPFRRPGHRHLAQRCHGNRRQRDLHLDQCTDPICGDERIYSQSHHRYLCGAMQIDSGQTFRNGDGNAQCAGNQGP